MSLTPVGIDTLPGRAARPGVQDGEGDGLFDLIAAAAAMHVVEVKASGGAGLPLGDKGYSQEQAVMLLAAPSVAPSGNTLTQSSPGALPSHEPAPLFSPSHDAQTAHDRQLKADDASQAVRHGTLPVIVSGQLVELALLKERRPSRDAGPTRRLSMVLDAAASGAVTLDARLQGDSLVIEFDGNAGTDAAARRDYAGEVQALARRLGWKFTDTMWEDAR